MSDIRNIGTSLSSSSVGSSLGTTAARAPGDLAARTSNEASIVAKNSPADRVEVSEVARWLEEMNRLPAIREDKVAAARAAIANGTLDTDEKLAIAVGRMIDDIG
jgi:negative regulator of flagellin synthesis FlgM